MAIRGGTECASARVAVREGVSVSLNQQVEAIHTQTMATRKHRPLPTNSTQNSNEGKIKVLTGKWTDNTKF